MKNTFKYAAMFTLIIFTCFGIYPFLSVIQADAASFDFTITSELRGNSTNIANGYTNVNDNLTITVNGLTGYNYTYSVKTPNTNSWNNIKSRTSDQSASYKPNEKGKYTFKVVFESNSGGQPPTTIEKNVTVYNLESSVSVNSTAIQLGESVTISAGASGGSGTYNYKYYYYYNSNSSTGTPQNISDWTTTSGLNFKPTKAGTYIIFVETQDSGTKKVIKKNVKLNVTSSKLVNSSYLSSSTIHPGDSFTVQAQASGGSGSYNYKYLVSSVEDDNFILYQTGFGSSDKYTQKWGNSSVGQYVVTVSVQDKNNTADIAIKKLYLTVEDEYKLTLTATISSTNLWTKNNKHDVGDDEFTINASASGGYGSYYYTYAYKKTTETLYHAFGEEPNVSENDGMPSENSNFTGQFLQAGKYNVCVSVQDGRGTSVRKTFIVTVRQAPNHDKTDLSYLIQEVDDWYDGLTGAQKKMFKNLKPNQGLSIDDFLYDDWNKARSEAKEFYSNGDVADTDKYYDSLKKQHDLALKQNLPTTDASDIYTNVVNNLSDSVNWLLNGIGGLMLQNLGSGEPPDNSSGGAGSNLTFFNIQGFVDIFSPIFIIFANALLVVLFGINVLSSTLQYELFSLRGALKLVGRLFLSKIWIDLSCKMCIFCINIACSLLSDIIGKSQSMLSSVDFNFVFMYSSDIPVVGYVIDFIVMLLVLIITAILFIPLLFFLLKVIMKLFVINFELAGLTAISPPFFACLCGESTAQYFKNFFTTFISVLAELIFMGIVYAAFISWYTSVGDLGINANITDFNILPQVSNMLTFSIVFIAACKLMIDPPQIFRNLIK